LRGDAASERDLAIVALGVIQAEAQGKSYLYRTAASFVAARIGLEPRPHMSMSEFNLARSGGGLIFIGSYVPKTSAQIQTLLETGMVTAIEVRVENLLKEHTHLAEIARACTAANQALDHSMDVVIFTSRQLIAGTDAEQNLLIGQQVSESLVKVMRGIRTRPRYILAKGGITSSDIATRVST
jgi:uncharacterized protein YgbK (DUF1537 family)